MKLRKLVMEQPMNADVEAFVGMAALLLGSAAAFLCYLVTESNAARRSCDRLLRIHAESLQPDPDHSESPRVF